MYVIKENFEWDSKKAEANVAKHGVSFEEACTVFSDIFALVIDDPDHSEEEDRFIIMGLSLQADVLVVCHCCREQARIRIMSAREATKNEEIQYWGARHER